MSWVPSAARRWLWRLACATAVLAAASQPSGAQVSGRVINGTTRQPAANVNVQYIQLQQGMVPLGTATTDKAGKFSFDNLKDSGSPALLRAEYQGAMYSQPLMGTAAPGSIEITVYEASRDPKAVEVREHAIFLHPAGDLMDIVEQIFLDNNSNPARTYVNPQGTYSFALPAKPAGEVEAVIEGAGGMPLPQTLTPLTAENTYAITYPIKPGETTLRIQYAVSYQSPMTLTKYFTERAEQTHIVIPTQGVKVRGENLQPAGEDPTQGFTAYRATPIAGLLKVEVSGQSPVSGADDSTASAEGGGLITIPDPIGRHRWAVVAGLGGVMLIGLAYLYSKG